MKKLIIQNVSKQFGEVHALHNVSLALDEGKMLAVLGPSGCGKTTLLRSIAGFETPNAGRIMINDQTLFSPQTNIKPEHRKIGYVPQHGVLFPHLTVANNIAFGLPNTHYQHKAKKEARVNDMLQLVGMDGLGHRMPHELSGGQQQRIALARALAPAPSLVLLDEPFSALDAGLRASLREEVKATLRQIGATAILVTHDQEEALSMADSVAVMRQGQCIQVADPVTLYQYPADLDVAHFVGEAITLAATLKAGQADCSFGKLPLAPVCTNEQTDAIIMIRPEQFVPCCHTEQQLAGQVIDTTYYGHNTLVHLKTNAQYGAHHIHIRVSGAHTYAKGEYMGLKIIGDVMAY
ncbi:ABC transporter ATP-binding protein [Oceanisphaera pacifica]|uniref:ABC transporter ATP-binding protein n=1 Tax=Oceanisphaera pacifica TaxID=2818389 RepID=A0ABS3NGP1_9GAMM|nr:ABC transporter ATP-binding protein [Oceanisphaera pacifica]MBO1519497.1 ABC transporter ATP-binding protein [Oceanisphaera pacifica]